MSPDRLRTRLMVAAQKFATEIADAVLEATGDRERVRDEEPARRRKPQRHPPAPEGPVDPAADRKAEIALAKLGIRKTG